MPEAYLFLTEGFEEIEALAVLDILRRGGVAVESVSLDGGWEVKGSHQITVKADLIFTPQAIDAGVKMMILPGGPGTARYLTHDAFVARLRAHYEAGGLIAAICAAPTVLGELGMLDGKTAVCYPPLSATLRCGRIGRGPVETDGTITTSLAAGTTGAFALAILRILRDEETARSVAEKMLIGL